MTGEAFASFLALPERDRRDVFASASRRLDTVPTYVEKDFWVCLVLDALFNGLPGGHPKLLFKGGTSLSKAFGLIRRFSEDIDLVVHRDGLGFAGDRDPTIAGGLSNKKRNALFKDLARACGEYVLGDLKAALTALIGGTAEGCAVRPDEEDGDEQTLLIEYPTLYSGGDVAYVAPRVRIEAGARSALEPGVTAAVVPYVAGDLPEWPFTERAHNLGDRRDAFEKMRDFTAEAYAAETGETWRPRHGSHTSQTGKLTSAAIDARDFVRARKDRETRAHLPEGTLVAVAGGKEAEDASAIWNALDTVRAKHDDMILVHGGGPGAERIAAKWADTRGIHQIVCKPDWDAHGRAAPFRRNDDLLNLLPRGVIAFPGSGITENLIDKARQLGIPVHRVAA